MTERIRVQLPDWRSWLTGHARQAAKDSSDYDLHLAAVEWGLSSSLDINRIEDFVSLPSPSVEPFAHQVEDAILFFRRLAPRGLIADDVGLGKTVTAGLVARELLDRGRIETVLVVCPRSLVDQWQEELDSKFAMKALIGVGNSFSDLQSHPFWITSYDTARSRIDAIRAHKFDLLILDEAHALRNLFGQPNAPQRARAFEQLMRDDSVRYCLMLTATPIQNRLWDIFSVLEILKAPQPNPLGTPDRFRSTYIADPAARRLRRGTEEDFRRKVAEATVRTRRKDTKLVFPEREVKTQPLRPLPDEKTFIDDALAAILALTNNKLTQMTHARTLMSSPWAAAAAFEREAEKPNITGQLRERLLALSRRGRAIRMSAKIEAVVTLARQSVVGDAPSRLIVFTQRLETLRHLADALREAGFDQHIGIMQGGEAEANRRAIRDFMAEPATRPILLSTDTGAVGLNLQAGNIVVNYDLPWNPMLLEQRIGRVQRLGQKARNVILYNLVLAGTIEEHVVLRLIEKLNLFNTAIGEMEELIELCGYGEEDYSLEQVIMNLIQKAAEQRDIEEDLKRMEESRRAAEAKMCEMREATEQALASIRPKDIGVRLEGLERVTPRLPLRELVSGCLKRGGVDLREEADAGIFVRLPGGVAELVFDRKVRPSANDQGVLVAVPGTRAFDHITKQIREDVVHHVVDATRVGLDRVREALADLLGPIGMILEDLRVAHRERMVALRVAVKATVQVPTDRYENIFEVDDFRNEDGVGSLLGAIGEIKDADGKAFSIVEDAPVRELGIRLAAVEPAVMARARSHDSIRRFSDFYNARYQEDLVRLLEHAQSLGHKADDGDPESVIESLARRIPVIKSAWDSLRMRFVPALRIDPIGVAAVEYEELELDARIRNRHQREVSAVRVVAIPLTGIIKSPIPGTTDVLGGAEGWACPGGHVVPRDDFVGCSDAGCTVGMCSTCHGAALVSAGALWECAECATPLCEQHRRICIGCEAALCGKHARRLSNRGEAACAQCCEQMDDGSWLLRTEVGVSAVSGAKALIGRFEKSALSGRNALPGEMVECEESGRKVLPDETVTCAITGKRVATDLVERSAVSGRQGLRSRMTQSAWSKRPCLPGEERICDETGALLLPDEIGECSLTRRHVRKDLLEEDADTKQRALRRLLGRSDVSGFWTAPEYLRHSEATGRTGLGRESAACEICHRRLMVDELLTCPETGRRGCPEHFASCEVSGQSVLPDSLVRCDVTGKQVRRSLVASCPETGKSACKDLFERCERSGTSVLPEGLATSSVSGKRVRRSLLVSCAVTGQLALQDELAACAVSGELVRSDVLITCPETGARFVPSHGAVCEESGSIVAPSALGECTQTSRRVRRSLLGRDDVSGDAVLERLLHTCSVTSARTIGENLTASSVSGKLALPDRVVKCEMTGRPALSGELGTCAVSGKAVHPDLLVSCPETGVRMLPSSAEQCQVTTALVSPTGLATCEATGKRVRRSLLGLDEVTGRVVLADLLRSCERTGRKTLAGSLVRSAVSGKQVLADIVRRCDETQAPALPEELARCESTGKLVLPGLLEPCQASGRTVLRNLLKPCEVSGQRVLPEYLSHCRRSGKMALTSLMGRSEISGETGVTDLLMSCEASKRRAFPDELVTTQVSGKRVARDRIVECPACGRTCDVGERVRCGICEQYYCSDDCLRGMCRPCIRLLTRNAGRKMSEGDLRPLRETWPWVRRGWIVESAGLRHMHVQSGRVSLRADSRLAVARRSPGMGSNDAIIVERSVDKKLVARARDRVGLLEGPTSPT